jgi:uncharacterized membrane protein
MFKLYYYHYRNIAFNYKQIKARLSSLNHSFVVIIIITIIIIIISIIISIVIIIITVIIIIIIIIIIINIIKCFPTQALPLFRSLEYILSQPYGTPSICPLPSKNTEKYPRKV